MIINEFGEIGLDHLLVETVGRRRQVTLQYPAACAARVRGDLVRTISELFLKRVTRARSRSSSAWWWRRPAWPTRRRSRKLS